MAAHGAGKDGEYNLCHFWSNFEIADLSEAYSQFFQNLDRCISTYVPHSATCRQAPTQVTMVARMCPV